MSVECPTCHGRGTIARRDHRGQRSCPVCAGDRVVIPGGEAAIERGARAIAEAHRRDGAPAFDEATAAERARWRGFSRSMATAFEGG
jgi:hypothetical protein